MKLSFDDINPIFDLSKTNINSIEKIENLLSRVKIDKKLKISARKKSQVRSIHSSLAIEANSLFLEDVNNLYDKKSSFAEW